MTWLAIAKCSDACRKREDSAFVESTWEQMARRAPLSPEISRTQIWMPVPKSCCFLETKKTETIQFCLNLICTFKSRCREGDFCTLRSCTWDHLLRDGLLLLLGVFYLLFVYSRWHPSALGPRPCCFCGAQLSQFAVGSPSRFVRHLLHAALCN